MLACSAALPFRIRHKTKYINKTETAMENKIFINSRLKIYQVIHFSTLKGKKVMIVNTASKCGLTPYKDLEAIYKEYKDQNFVIIGFPANNFGSQEPGTNEEIALPTN
jgi:glutathione peroxidase